SSFTNHFSLSNKPWTTFVSGYISDLSLVKDNIKLRVRILRAWLQPLYNNQKVKNMEMIVMDEHNTKMQATVRMDKLKRFQHHLKEGNALTIQRYSLGEIKPKFRMVYNAMRLSFLSNTEVDLCTDFNGSVHCFVWRPFKPITDLEKEEDGQFDVFGQVIACEDLDNYDKNGKARKKPVTLIDDELFANQPSEQSENTAMKVSIAFKNSTNVTFVNKHPIRNIAELLGVEQGVQSVIVGTVIAIQEDEGWWYLRCRRCRGKVIKSSDYIDLESEMPKKTDGPNDWWMRLEQCRSRFSTMRFRLWLVALLINYVKNMQRIMKLQHIPDNHFVDLESQTDKNKTPNEKQKTNKRPAEGEPRNTTMDENDPANARKCKKDLMSNRKRASSKDKRSNPSFSSDAFLTDNSLNGSLPLLSLSNRSSTQIYNIAGLSTSSAHPQPTIRNRMSLSDITNFTLKKHVVRHDKQGPNKTSSIVVTPTIRPFSTQTSTYEVSESSRRIKRSKIPALQNRTPIRFNLDDDGNVRKVYDKYYGISEEYYDHGDPTFEFKECHSLLWEAEAKRGNPNPVNKAYSICCKKGKVMLEKPPDTPKPLLDLFLNYDGKSQNFRNNIRTYNSMFSFTSIGGKVDDSVNRRGRGPYILRLHGQTTIVWVVCFSRKDRTNQENLFTRGGRLFQQFLVDGYTMVETERLYFHRAKQSKLRCDTYSNIRSSIAVGNTDPTVLGKPVVLSSSFTGGPRYMRQDYMDAMALCRWYGSPDLFITITCNLNWPENARYMREHNLTSTDRPDVLSRVFKMKLNQLMKDVKELRLFGRVQAEGYPFYRRRGDGKYVEKSGHRFHNGFVIPYNATLLKRYQCHINVEWCNQAGSIKYLFKYINKGPDRVLTELYEPATTAMWRLFGFEVQYRTPFVERLLFHLLGEQHVLYDENSDLETVLHKPSVGHSMFEGWMKINELYPVARELTYAEFPTKYVWDAPKRIWTLRKQGKSIGRIHNVPISIGDAFYCRMLLNSAKGCRTHDEIKKVNGVVYHTYKEACYAMGLLEDDKEYIEYLVVSDEEKKNVLCFISKNLCDREASSPSYSKRITTRHCKRIFKAILLVGSLQEWILKVEDGELGEANDGEVSIDVPEELIIDAADDPVTSIIDFTYSNLLNNINNPSYFQEKAILAPTNEVVDTLNDHLLNKYPGEEIVYLSCDSIDKTKRGSAIDEAVFSPKFINGLKFLGVPNHTLALKVGVPIMLLRNIDQANGLCNGTRLQVLRLTRTSIQAKIINGTHFENEVIIPRLRITPSNKRLPIKIVRKQYPLSLSFAMTINKNQGQPLSKVGLYLPRPVFTHEQLYVALSRVKSKRGLKVVVCDEEGNVSKTTTNVVYKEVLHGL
nr:ATP-dependent DNA helicase PIF1-like [Tanacetum cinerariifolium]